MAVEMVTRINKYIVASGDTKPTTGIPAGSLAFETDTSDTYILKSGAWVVFKGQGSELWL